MDAISVAIVVIPIPLAAVRVIAHVNQAGNTVHDDGPGEGVVPLLDL